LIRRARSPISSRSVSIRKVKARSCKPPYSYTTLTSLFWQWQLGISLIPMLNEGSSHKNASDQPSSLSLFFLFFFIAFYTRIQQASQWHLFTIFYTFFQKVYTPILETWLHPTLNLIRLANMPGCSLTTMTLSLLTGCTAWARPKTRPPSSLRYRLKKLRR
jgi:hypothetical protein